MLGPAAIHAYLGAARREGRAELVIGTVTDGIARGVETVTGAVNEALFEPVIRLGVTGLARSGKTVFITSLVANLLERGRMGGMQAVASGAIQAAYLRPQPDDTVPRFPFETNRATMTGAEPAWPLPPDPGARRGSLYREFARRYDAYRREVVRPFFRDHFARIDRQIILVDALGALANGPQAVADLSQTMTDLLGAFRPGQNTWLAALLGRRIDRLLFAATKADHVHHSQHDRLTAFMEALVADARRRADFSGARTGAMAIASLRATVEEERSHKGQALAVVRGRLADTGREAAFSPGALPENPAALLQRQDWTPGDWQAQAFLPAPLTLRPGEGPPHIRLDKAAEFLLGDRLR